MRRRLVAALVSAFALVGVGASPALAKVEGSGPKPVDLDVLFIGAHPDDEAGGLSTYGQWAEQHGIETGVITITRGEGGGNAQGPEEGPSLGLIREAEERRAVGMAGIENIFYLDKVDFWYTLSAPLTDQIWGHQDTLERMVRIVRMTRPEVIFTMDPSPNTHGNHAQAARMAIETYRLAADPNAFPEQLTEEGLDVWRVSKIFRFGASGTTAPAATPDGSDCPNTFTPREPTDIVYGIWSGTQSTQWGTSWAQVERTAQRQYLTQGWGAFPPVVNPPFGCDRVTLIDSRVPFELEGTTPFANTPDATTAALQGALVNPVDGLPLGTEFYLEVDPFEVVAGNTFQVTVHARRPGGLPAIRNARVTLDVPAGWTVSGDGNLGLIRQSDTTTTFTVTVAEDAAENTRFLLKATLSAEKARTGTTYEPVEVVPAVEGTLERLPDIAEFEAWARGAEAPQLIGLVQHVLPLGAGETRDVSVVLENHTGSAESGEVRLLNLPAGITATPATQSYTVGPHGTTTVTFSVTADAAIQTSRQVSFDIETTSSTGPSTEKPQPGFFLVPTTTIPQAAGTPTVDGVASPGEYDNAPTLDLSKLWEGDPASFGGPADWSGTAKVVWSNDALYFLIQVTDDVLGAPVSQADCKRHWRTDSIEIALDPRGRSDNTSTVFKTGIFPVTQEGGPCAERDADNWQGPAAVTAPGMQVASTITAPYTGYTLEVKIDLADLPMAVDPSRLGMNIIGYDSDTQDLTGQHRLAWQNVGPAQVVPYTWGLATLPGYVPPADRPTTPRAPTIPTDVARSYLSPQSILQSAMNGIPLAGLPKVRNAEQAEVAGNTAVLENGVITLTLRTKVAGTAHLFAWDVDWADAYRAAVDAPHVVVDTGSHGLVNRTITIDVGSSGFTDGYVVIAWQPAGAEGWQSIAVPVSTGGA